MSLQGFFQNAYVTHDLDRAISLCSAATGIGQFMPMDLELPLLTSEGERSIRLRVATGWIGKLQIELIQPVSGYIAPYASGLAADPSDATPRFHHVAVRRDDAEALVREVETLALPVIFRTSGNGISSVFVDASASFGHPIEFVCATPEGWNLLGWPKST